MGQKFIVFSADALVTEDLKLLETMPNYRKYVLGGARTESMQSIYPSVTYAAHTAMATGCVPGKTGISGNFERLEPARLAPHPWALDHKLVKVPDIFTAAKRAGLTTASVFWPVTGNHPDVDYLINEWPGCAPDIPIGEALKRRAVRRRCAASRACTRGRCAARAITPAAIISWPTAPRRSSAVMRPTSPCCTRRT